MLLANYRLWGFLGIVVPAQAQSAALCYPGQRCTSAAEVDGSYTCKSGICEFNASSIRAQCAANGTCCYVAAGSVATCSADFAFCFANAAASTATCSGSGNCIARVPNSTVTCNNLGSGQTSCFASAAGATAVCAGDGALCYATKASATASCAGGGSKCHAFANKTSLVCAGNTSCLAFATAALSCSGNSSCIAFASRSTLTCGPTSTCSAAQADLVNITTVQCRDDDLASCSALIGGALCLTNSSNMSCTFVVHANGSVACSAGLCQMPTLTSTSTTSSTPTASTAAGLSQTIIIGAASGGGVLVVVLVLVVVFVGFCVRRRRQQNTRQIKWRGFDKKGQEVGKGGLGVKIEKIVWDVDVHRPERYGLLPQLMMMSPEREGSGSEDPSPRSRRCGKTPTSSPSPSVASERLSAMAYSQALLDTLSKDAIRELALKQKAPAEVVKVLNAVLVLLEEEQSWSEARLAMADGEAFLQRLKEYQLGIDQESTLMKLELFLGDREFVPEQIVTISPTAAVLCSWVHHVAGSAKKLQVPKATVSRVPDGMWLNGGSEALCGWGSGRLKRGRRGFVHDAFADGQRLEYYSHRFKCWTHCVVERRDGVLDETIAYMVSAGNTRQNRPYVCCDQLRPLLEKDEPVSLLLEQEWVPGTLMARCPIGKLRRIYSVKLDGNGQAHHAVGADRVRRTYRTGEEVEVYTGPSAGWKSSVVVQEHPDVAPPVRPEVTRQKQIPVWQMVTVSMTHQDVTEDRLVPAYFLRRKICEDHVIAI